MSRGFLQGLLSRAHAAAGRLDRAAVPLLRPLPSALKQRAVRAGFRLAAAFLPEVVEVDGLRLAVPRNQRLGYALRGHEPAVVQLIKRHVPPGGTAVDVGGNIGYLTLHMARHAGAAGRVVSLEPAPENLVFLLRNVALNEATNVEVLAVGAGASRRLRTFHLHRVGTRHGFRASGPEVKGELTVAEVPLDELLEGPVDFVKIDVEGTELEVLAGMQRLLARRPRPRLVVEWSPGRALRAGEAAYAVPDFLRERGLLVHVLGTSADSLPSIEGFRPPAGAVSARSTWRANLFASPPGEGE